jgi:hypothetical protein
MTRQQIAVGFPFAVFSTISVATVSLNDADNAVGTVFFAPKDGTVDRVGFFVPLMAGSPPAYNVGLVTVGADGYPTSTAAAGSALASFTPVSAGWQWVTLPTAGVVSRGQAVAVHIWPGSVAPDSSNYISVCRGSFTEGPFSVYSTSSFLPTYGATLMALSYDDGDVCGYALSSHDVGLTVTASTTPDEIGVKFSLPFDATLVGVLPRFNRSALGSAAQVQLKVYDAGGTLLDSLDIVDKDYLDAAEAVTLPVANVPLTKDTVYRLTFLATVSTNGAIPYYKFVFESAAAKAYVPWASNFMFTERADGGVWTDTELGLAPWVLLLDVDFAEIGGEGVRAAKWVMLG